MSPFAVIRSGGKQYKVSEGDTILVEKLNTEKNSTINLDEVLLISREGKTSIGKPLVDKAKIKAKVIDNLRDKKVRVVKFKSKSRYMRTQGHRQSKTKLVVGKIPS